MKERQDAVPYNKGVFGNGARFLKDEVVEPRVQQQLVAVLGLDVADAAVEKSLDLLVLAEGAIGVRAAFQLVQAAVGEVLEGWAHRISNSREGGLELLEALRGGLRLGVVIEFLPATTAVGSLSRLGKTSDVCADGLGPTTTTASAAKGGCVCGWWLAHDAMWCARGVLCVLCMRECMKGCMKESGQGERSKKVGGELKSVKKRDNGHERHDKGSRATTSMWRDVVKGYA